MAAVHPSTQLAQIYGLGNPELLDGRHARIVSLAPVPELASVPMVIA